MVSYQWGIFWAELDPSKGVEQAGKRPVLVISVDEVNANLPIVTVLPLTSLKDGRQIYPIEAFLPKQETGLSKDSIAMAHQIRAISINRLQNKCGMIQSEPLREQVRQIMKIYLGL